MLGETRVRFLSVTRDMKLLMLWRLKNVVKHSFMSIDTSEAARSQPLA